MNSVDHHRFKLTEELESLVKTKDTALQSQNLDMSSRVQSFRGMKEYIESLIELASQLERENDNFKKHHADLEQTQKQYLNHFELAPVGHMLLDQAGIILQCNVLAAKILGVEQEFLNKSRTSMVRYLSPNSVRDFQKHFREVLKNQQAESCELEIITKEGQPRSVQIHSVVSLRSDNVMEIYSTLNDVAKLKHARLELQKQKEEIEKLSLVASRTDNMVCIVDAHGNIEWVNRAFENITEHALEEIRGSNLIDTLKNAGAVDTHALEQLVKGVEDRVAVHVEMRTSSKMGSDYWLDVELQPDRGKHHNSSGFMFMGRDVTRRKQMEQFLMRSKERIRQDREQLRLTMDQAPVGIFVLDLNGCFTRVNNALCHILGYDEKELLKMNWNEVASSKAMHRRRELVTRLLEGFSEIEMMEEVLVDRQKQEIDVICRFGLLSSSEGEPEFIVGMLEDVSLKKKEEEERLRVCKLESLGLLAGGIAHDLNNIIMGITMGLELAIEDFEGDVDTLESLEDAQGAALRAKDLSNRLLTFSKGGEPIKQPGDVMLTIIDTVKFALRGSNLKAKISHHGDAFISDIDRNQISQVIENIVINAREASPSGDLEISIKHSQIEEDALLENGEYIEIIFCDHGEGIPKEVLPKIFDPYFTTKEKGNGLGLATCHSIISKHGGTIKVDSKKGEGATFRILLPQLKGKNVQSDIDIIDQPLCGNLHVLVVDDEAAICKLVSRGLTSLGYKVQTVEDGQQAFNQYKQALQSDHPIDVVLLDATIPGGIGGEKALKLLKGIDPDVCALLCSGYADGNLMCDWKEAGFSGILKKPFSMTEVSHMIHRVRQQ
ncbi:MAG: PAS domain S-box protein [Verrucomicrobiota bacterium]